MQQHILFIQTGIYALKVKFCVFIFIFSLAINANATCFKEAAERFRVNELVLIAIAKTESGFDAKAFHINADGSYDMGMMQINSRHLQDIRKFGIVEKDLFNACTSIQVAAWILARYIAIHGNTWKAVGSYNTGPRGSAEKQAAYATKISDNLIAMGAKSNTTQ